MPQHATVLGDHEELGNCKHYLTVVHIIMFCKPMTARHLEVEPAAGELDLFDNVASDELWLAEKNGVPSLPDDEALVVLVEDDVIGQLNRADNRVQYLVNLRSPLPKFLPRLHGSDRR